MSKRKVGDFKMITNVVGRREYCTDTFERTYVGNGEWSTCEDCGYHICNCLDGKYKEQWLSHEMHAWMSEQRPAGPYWDLHASNATGRNGLGIGVWSQRARKWRSCVIEGLYEWNPDETKPLVKDEIEKLVAALEMEAEHERQA